MLYTTVKLLKVNDGAYPERFVELSCYGPDEPIPLSKILEMFGLEETLLALRATTTPNETEQFMKLLACDYAEHMQPMCEKWRLDEDRGQRAIKAARRFLRGEATRDELLAAIQSAVNAGTEALEEGVKAQSSERFDQIVEAVHAIEAAANAAQIVAGTALFVTDVYDLFINIRYDTEQEREWQTRHLAKMLEEFEPGGER